MIVVSIDPGISGACVRLEDGKLTAMRDFKARRDIARAVATLSPGADVVVIEAVNARPGEGVCSVFSFGRSTGVAEGAIYTTHLGRMIEVHPLKWTNYWKKKLGLPKKPFKEMTRDVAIGLFPAQADLFKRKKDHGTSDAALIALWAKETL